MAAEEDEINNTSNNITNGCWEDNNNVTGKIINYLQIMQIHTNVFIHEQMQVAAYQMGQHEDAGVN